MCTLLLLLLLLLYMKSIYRKSVCKVTEENFQDLKIETQKMELDQATANDLNMDNNYVKNVFTQKDKFLTSNFTLHE